MNSKHEDYQELKRFCVLFFQEVHETGQKLQKIVNKTPLNQEAFQTLFNLETILKYGKYRMNSKDGKLGGNYHFSLHEFDQLNS